MDSSGCLSPLSQAASSLKPRYGDRFIPARVGNTWHLTYPSSSTLNVSYFNRIWTFIIIVVIYYYLLSRAALDPSDYLVSKDIGTACKSFFSVMGYIMSWRKARVWMPPANVCTICMLKVFEIVNSVWSVFPEKTCVRCDKRKFEEATTEERVWVLLLLVFISILLITENVQHVTGNFHVFWNW